MEVGSLSVCEGSGSSKASSRGGKVALRLAGDRVHLTGSAVTVMRGELAAG